MEEQNTNKNTRFPGGIFCALSLPVCALAAVFYHRSVFFAAALIALSALDIVFCVLKKKGALILIPAALVFACGVSALFLHSYLWVLILFSIAFVFSFVGLILRLVKAWKEGGSKRLVIKIIAACLCAVILSSALLLGFFPDIFFRYAMQGGVMDHKTSFSDSIRPDGVREIRDVEYPSAYPNNTMLLFLSAQNRGTIFFIHGGGFVLGDKTSAENAYFQNWVKAGYNVVSVDYVLAPQYRIEKQLIQCGEALRFFMAHAKEWGIDKDRVVLAGESAGGCLSGLLAADLSGKGNYGVKIRGWISIGGLVDIPHFGDTNDDFVSYGFNLMGVCAFNNPGYADTEKAKNFSVLEQVTADFPPAYISDGNRGTFTDQGIALAKKLRSLGVKVETNFIPDEAGIRGHVFEMNTDADPLARENFRKTLAFVEEILK